MKRFRDPYLVAKAAPALLAVVLEYVDADPRDLSPGAAARHQRALDALDLADRGQQPTALVRRMTAAARAIERTERKLA